jgi:uncharacterized protein (TIGR03086 family)
MTADRSPIAVLDSGLDQLAALVESVGDDDLDKPTPCSDWSVSDLVDHIVRSIANLAASTRGAEADWSGTTPHHEEAGPPFRANADDLRAAWSATDDPQAGGGVDWQLAELATHTWDLATALGRDTAELDPEVAERGLAFMSKALTPENRGPVFKPEQPAPPDGDPYQRIAAFAGREVTR